MRASAVVLVLLLLAPTASAAVPPPPAPPALEGSEGFICDDPFIGSATCGPGRAVCAFITQPQSGYFRTWLVIFCSLMFGYCPPDVFCL
ncbi:MAG TPA: hypothetical protein VGR28_05475 [Candidatus Thermoplasmatota archaeon]|jgi:hypothetical protein|nr:hypothetical protein [Candidatus Thermoplasmatota archaeon]